MRIARWISNAKDPHSQYVTPTVSTATAVIQKRLNSNFTYIGCLVVVCLRLAQRVKTEQWPVKVRAVCVELSELRNQLHTYNK
jgi:hypothetical protein